MRLYIDKNACPNVDDSKSNNELSILEYKENNTVQTPQTTVYPNPNSGVFTLKFQGNMSLVQKVEIFSAAGVLVLGQTITQSTNKLDISKYPKGIYILKITSGEAQHYEKIIYR
ncbi:MAG: T9SS type A sorting domain-containing protein [Chloroflexia bacterium]|nr:T9SS type A sorting domain-containing protein [Chloroflexia bacterium]